MDKGEPDGLYTNLKIRKDDNRYLICDHCFGYYKLKNNEYPEHFKECECGGPLTYHQNIEIENFFDDQNSENRNTVYNSSKKKLNTDNSNEKILKKLHGNIKEQEMALKDIKHQKIIDITNDDWSLWDRLDSIEAQRSPHDQKMIDNEIKKQENKLLLQVKNKRKDASFNLKNLLRS